jgi:flavodoxin
LQTFNNKGYIIANFSIAMTLSKYIFAYSKNEKNMKKALIIYMSKKGTTKYFGHNIGEYLKQKDINVTVASAYDVKPETINDFDYILLGCWTNGLFLLLQHPEKDWVKFAKQLPDLKGKKVALFTTYKLATGSMFKNMAKALSMDVHNINTLLKAKSENLNDIHRASIDKFIG